MVTSGRRKCIKPPIAAKHRTSHRFPSLFNAVTSTRNVQHFSPERTHSSSISTHRLLTIALSRSRLSSTAKGLFFPSSNEGDARVGSSILKIIFPSLGLVSGGRSSEAVTWQRARVDPIDAIQTPNSLPNEIE